MPSLSKAQQAASAIAKKVKAGKMKAKPGSPSAQMANSMNMGQLDEFASTSATGLPKHTGPPPPPAPRAPAQAKKPKPSTGKPIKVNQTPTGAIKKIKTKKR